MNESLASERYLTADEERQLFAVVNSFGDVYARRDAAWMQLLRQTGIRIGTMAKLTVADALLALKNNRLVLRDEICKRQKGYSVPMNKKAMKALKQLMKVRVEIIKKQDPNNERGLKDDPAAPLVMSRKHDQYMSVRSYQARLFMWRMKAGLEVDVTPHYFRHTVGHRIMERSTAGNPLLIVKAALGHGNINSSAVYTRPNREQIAMAMEAMS